MLCSPKQGRQHVIDVFSERVNADKLISSTAIHQYTVLFHSTYSVIRLRRSLIQPIEDTSQEIEDEILLDREGKV